jgi:HK97 family phage portal protein
LGEDIGKLPLSVVQRQPNGAKRPRPDHPLHELLAWQPNPWQSAMEFKQTLMLHALLCKAGYAFINRAKDGSVLELIPLLPSRVIPRQLPDWTIVYDVADGSGGQMRLAREQVFALQGPSWNGFSALELLTQGSEAIGLAMAAEQTQALMHGNGAKPGGVLSSPNVLTTEQIARIKDQFQMGYGGVQNAFRTLLLDNGIKWEPFQMTGVDLQHLETRRFQVEEISRLFGVYPQRIGYSDKTATYASASAFMLAYVIDCLQPWAVRLEQAIRRDLFTSVERNLGYEAFIDFEGLLRGSPTERAQYYQAAIAGGWASRNEVRLKDGWGDPIPGLDEILPPLGSTAVPPPKGNAP